MPSIELNRRFLLTASIAVLSGRALAQTATPSVPPVPAASPAAPAADAASPGLSLVASFEQQVTGVAVAPNGRIFVNFPRWDTDVPVSVAEVMKDGTLKPYPDAAWNSYTNLKKPDPATAFVCVQSVTVDNQGNLWVLDPAAPGNEFILPNGPKLVKIDLKTDKVVQVIHFDMTAAPQGSYMNDVRFSPDGRHAYLTDSGQKGALLVIDLPNGKPRRVLDGDPSTQPEPGVVPQYDGHDVRRPDNRIPAFAADGIALDPKGEFLYWQALDGKTLYRIPTSAMTAATSPAKTKAAVQKVAETHVADGLWMDKAGYLFITNPGNNSVDMRAPDGKTTTVAKDPRLVWPDSMAEGADGSIYVTASHIPEMAEYHEHGSTRTGPTTLWRIAKPHP